MSMEEKKYEYPLLSDPKHNRAVPEVAPPPHKPLSKAALFPEGSQLPRDP